MSRSRQDARRVGQEPASRTRSHASKARPRPRRASSEEDKQERRQHILSAAKTVFARKGYHATTMADIAKQAGLSYGSVYWYFDSKEALFDALMNDLGQALRSYVKEALDTTPSDRRPDAPFREAVRRTFEFFESDRALVKLLFRDSYALGDRFEKHLFGIHERFVADIEAVLEDAKRQGQMADYPTRMAAFCVAALIGQVAHRRLVTDDGLSAEVVADFVVTLLLNGLLPRRETPSLRAGRTSRS